MPTQDRHGRHTGDTLHVLALPTSSHPDSPPTPVWAASADLAEINEACADSSPISQLLFFNNP